MKINRPRLLAGSLAIALVVIGVFAWTQAGDDVAAPEVELEDPQDREIPAEAFPDGTIPTNEAMQGEILPSAIVLDADNNEVSSDSFLGTPLVINFWHSNCPPCEKELPDFAEVDAEVGDEVRFIGINPLDSVPVMERFAAERGVTYELYLDFFAEMQQGAGVVAFPQTLFVTSDGEIIDQIGLIDADGLREKVANLQEMESQ